MISPKERDFEVLKSTTIMATNNNDHRDNDEETNTKVWLRMMSIGKKIKKKKKKISLMNDFSVRDLSLQGLKEIVMHVSSDVESLAALRMCLKCNVPVFSGCSSMCKTCRESPKRILHRLGILEYCRHCMFYTHLGTSIRCQAALKSVELMNFLLRKLEQDPLRLPQVVKDAQFMETPCDSYRIAIGVQLQAPQPPLITLRIEFLVVDKACLSCSRQFVASDPHETEMLCRFLDKIKQLKIKRVQNCFATLGCPIRRKDLILLPSKVSAALGDINPLVICSRLIPGSIGLLDPFSVRASSLNINEYWKNPFNSLKTKKDLVQFLVVNVEVGLSALLNVNVALVSDSGKDDQIFTLRTHLGHNLKPGDYVVGYDLRGMNISNLPEFVLVRKTNNVAQAKEIINSSPEYLQFLRDLEKNPEDNFNVSLNDKEGSLQKSSTKTLEDVAIELEDLLADLKLSDKDRNISEKL